MKSSREVKRIEEDQDQRLFYRKVAFHVLKKAFQQHSGDAITVAMDNLQQGKSLSKTEFNMVATLAQQLQKPIPSEKLERIKTALTTPLVLRYFNVFGQTLK